MEGKLRSIANPLSNMRFEAILETTLVKTAKAVDDLAESLANTNLSHTKSEPVMCKCTRKCATKAYPCKKIGKKCHTKCHPSNNQCTNTK